MTFRIGCISVENVEVVLPASDEEYVRIVRKVETKDTEPRNFIKDKLCAIGLADVSNIMQLCNIRTLGMVMLYLRYSVTSQNP